MPVLSRRSVLCLFAGAAALFAQAPIPSAGVSGVVTNAINGAPLPRVHITFGMDGEDGRIFGAMTTVEGKFSITGMTPGSYAVTMQRVGFSMLTLPDAQENPELGPGERKDGLKFTMIPTGAISGRVTNAEGAPVEFVSVSAESAAGAPGDVAATTDLNGRFRIGGLAPGRYRVLATPENSYTPVESRTDGTVDVQDAPTVREGARVAVTPAGDASGIDIRLARVPIVEVSGRVENAPAGSLSARLRIASADGSSRSVAGIRPDGTFRLWRLVPGKYEISAIWQVSGGGQAESAPVPIGVAGANIDHLSVWLIPPADIAGHIVFADEGARPGQGTTARLILVNTGLHGGVATADVAADGSFHLPQVRAGRYRIGLSWRNAYIASMQLGALAMDGPALDLTTDATGDLSIRLSAAAGVVSGIVTDGAGKGAAVVLAPDDAIGGGAVSVFSRSTVAGPDGAYIFRNVAPGKYRLAAVPPADADSVQQGGESLAVHAGEKLSRDLKMQAPEEQ